MSLCVTGAPASNLLVPVLTQTTVTPTETRNGTDYTNFLLTGHNDGSTTTYGFYRFSKNQTVGAGKAYLSIPTADVNSASNASNRFMSWFDDEDVELSEIEGLSIQETSSETTFDLQGRRVARPTHGLYIRNGKKVVIK